MLAGGADAAIIPSGMGGFIACKALSMKNDQPEKASRPWDKGRDGFVMGEGAGVHPLAFSHPLANPIEAVTAVAYLHASLSLAHVSLIAVSKTPQVSSNACQPPLTSNPPHHHSYMEGVIPFRSCTTVIHLSHSNYEAL